MFGKTKRLMAMVLTVCLVMGFIPVAAGASFENQVGPYQHIGADNQAVPASPNQAATPQIKLENGSTIDMSKSIEQTGTDLFTITLKVETTEEQKTVSTGKSADVVLVFDVSTSMDYVPGSGDDIEPGDSGWSLDKTRWTALKASATEFINGLLAEGSGNRVAIVVYGGSNDKNAKVVHKTIQDWTSDAATAIASFSGYKVVTSSYETVKQLTCTKTNWGHRHSDSCYTNFSHGTSLRKAKFSDSSTNYGSTNNQAGFVGAQVELGNRGTSTNAPYVVYMSDGVTNGYYRSGDASTYSVIETWNASTYNARKATDCSDSDAAAAAKAQAAKLKALYPSTIVYTVGFGLGANGNDVMNPKTADNNGNSGVDRYFPADDAEDLKAVYGTINDEIVNGTKAGKVVDPMGPMIEWKGLVDSSIPANVASFEDGVLTWNMGNGEPTTRETIVDGVKTTVYVYELQYNIRLKTDDVNFDETINHLTNGQTTLSYNLYDKSGTVGETETAYFNIPTVTGKVPVYTLNIEHYLEQEDGTYALQEADTETKPVKLHETVEASGYDKTKAVEPGAYANYDYNPDYEDAVNRVTVTGDGQTLKLYYDRTLTSVTVEHYYEVITIDVNGIETGKDVWNHDPVLDSHVDHNQWVGQTYDAIRNTKEGTYTFVKADPSERITVAESGNVIKLYYTRTSDNRTNATLDVKETFITKEWQIVGGKYEQVVIGNTSNTEKGLYTFKSPYKSEQYTHADYQDYKLIDWTYNGSTNPDDKDGNTITYIPKEGTNTIHLTFEKVIDNRIPATVTINHNYYKRIITVDEFGAKSVDEGTWSREPVTIDKCYVDETLTLGADYEHYDDVNGVIYPISKSLPDTITVSATAKDNVYSAEYSLIDEPDTATVSVTHTYREWDYEIDSEGKTTRTLINESTVDGVSESNLFHGEKYTATPIVENGGKQYVWDNGVNWAIADTNEEKVIELFYDLDPGTPDVGSVTVVHQYTRVKHEIVNGKSETNTKNYSETVGPLYDVVGEDYVIVPELTYGNETYVRTDSQGLEVKYAKENNVFTLTYYLETDERIGTSLTAEHKYYSEQMAIDGNNTPYYQSAVLDHETDVFVAYLADENWDPIGDPLNTAVGGDLYEGMRVYIELVDTLGSVEYTERSTNPGNGFVLGSANHKVFEYERKIDLGKVTIEVTHTYNNTIYTYDNGVESSRVETTYNENPITKELYIGQSYTAETIPADYKLDSAKFNRNDITDFTVVAVDGTNLVEFVYSKTSGYRLPASVTVNHYYTSIDWDGTIYGYNAEKPDGYVLGEDDTQTVKSFAGLNYTGKVELRADANGENAYTLLTDKTTSNPAFSTEEGLPEYTITMEAGDENVINFFYQKKVDTRKATTITVIHRYYNMRDITDASATYTEEKTTYSTITPDNIWIGNKFVASIKATADHEYFSSNPDKDTGDAKTITIAELQEKNEDIIINYVPVIIPHYTYNIVRQYYTTANGTRGLTGTQTFTESVPETEVDSLEVFRAYNENEYNGTPYTFASFTYKIGEATVQNPGTTEGVEVAINDGEVTFTLTYERTVTPSSEPTDPTEPTTTEPVPPVTTTTPPEEEITTTNPVTDYTTQPTTAAPETTAPVTEVEIIEEEPIEEEEIILEDVLADLPATGVLTPPVSVTWTLGTLAVLASMGVAIKQMRKKEEQQ